MKAMLMFLLLGSCLIFMSPSRIKAEAPEIGALVRIQYNNLRGDSYPYQVSSFDISSIRPYWNGALIDNKLKYKLVLAFEKNSSDIMVLDAYGDYEISKAVNIRFGQYKVPFDRQYLTPTEAMPFIELGAGALKLFKRDRGITIRGKLTKAILTYDLGFFNGTGLTTDFNAKNTLGENKQQHLVTGRVTINPQGEYGYKLALPGEADKLKTSAGFAFATGQKDNDSTDVVAYCFDVAIRTKGVTAMFEYQNEDLEDPRKKTTTSGMTTKAGYFFRPDLEVLGRYSSKKINNNFTTTEMTFGVNYYVATNNAKIQLNYTRVENETTAANKTVDHLIKVLYQILF